MNSQNETQWLIITDLDGTLLDHHTYRFDAAQGTLNKLRQHNVPVIINSSKTASEIEQLKIALKNSHPFIAENGSGIFIPQIHCSLPPDGASIWKNYWKITLGKDREDIITALKKIPSDLLQQCRAFHRMSIDDIVKATGLSMEEARLSADRHYTEPLQWLGDTDQKKIFLGYLHQQHIYYTEGGRFIHLMGHTNKGSASRWLAEHYQEKNQKLVKIIALGDGINDIDMLKSADIAVVIRSPVNPPPEFEHPCKLISDSIGPQGWSEAIEQLFFTQQKTQA